MNVAFSPGAHRSRATRAGVRRGYRGSWEGSTPACTLAAEGLIEKIAARVHPVSSPEAAELTKLYENSFRAVNIAFANEIAGVGRRFGLDPLEVIEAAGTKPYGFMAFYPGSGRRRALHPVRPALLAVGATRRAGDGAGARAGDEADRRTAAGRGGPRGRAAREP